MKTMKLTNAFKTRRLSRQRGFSLLEFLIAMTVLTIGVGGLLPLLLGALTLDKKAAGDTTSTMVAEVVLEQISAQGAPSLDTVSITDCANPPNTPIISMGDAIIGQGSGGTYGGNGATLTSQGSIDWTEPYGNIPAGYAMQYVACSTTNDTRVAYDVRWDLIKTSQSDNTKLVVVSARPVVNSPVALGYILPVNLRTVVGMP